MLTSAQEACWLQEVLRNPSSGLFALIDKAHSPHTGGIREVTCKMKHPEVWAISGAASGSFGARIHQAHRSLLLIASGQVIYAAMSSDRRFWKAQGYYPHTQRSQAAEGLTLKSIHGDHM